MVLAGGLVSLQAISWPPSAQAAVHRVAASNAITAPPVAAPVQPAVVRTATSGPKREVFGFALASSLADPSFGYTSWNFSALSTVAFFGLHINTDGTMSADSDWSVWSSPTMTGLLTIAHAHGTKVVMTIVLQDFSPGTPTMCTGLANRATTVIMTVAQLNAKHVDGVNVDYEGLNGTCPNGQTAQAMMTDFVYRLRSALPSGTYLSIDTYASSASDSLGFFDVAGLAPYVDSFFVMAYDLEYSNYRRSPQGCASFCLGPTAPLSGYYYNDTSTAAQYVSVVGPSKVILGVPYYGRKACVGGVAASAYPIGAVSADSYLSALDESTDPVVAAGSYTAHRDANDPAGQERWDTWFNNSLGCTRELYWDDATSLGLKYDLVNRDGLRGVGIWNLNYGGGAPELWSALLTHFAGCPGVQVAANPAPPAAVGVSAAFAATASGCANPNLLYEYWMLAPGSSTWQAVQPYSTSGQLAWPTVGKVPGSYLFNVWVRDASSPGIFGNALGRWDSYAAFAYTLTATACTGMTAALSPAGSALVGAAVTVTAAAAGCPNPRYEFWLLPPGSSTWLLAREYSASAVFSWNAWATPGTYRWSVWARDASSLGTTSTSLGTWDAYTAPQYVVATPCSSVSVSAAPAMAPPGATVVISAAAIGCAHPLFEFFLLPPGSSTWLLGQAYGSSATYSWNTAGYATGAYQISVWARDAYSPGTTTTTLGTWDAYKNVTYSLVTQCSSVTLGVSPAGSAKAGSTLTVTAAASACANPQYAFWVLPPGSSTWLVLRAYGSGGSATWNTAGEPAGTYRFAVWARDASSPGTTSNALGSFDASNLLAYPLT